MCKGKSLQNTMKDFGISLKFFKEFGIYCLFSKILAKDLKDFLYLFEIFSRFCKVSKFLK